MKGGEKKWKRKDSTKSHTPTAPILKRTIVCKQTCLPISVPQLRSLAILFRPFKWFAGVAGGGRQRFVGWERKIWVGQTKFQSGKITRDEDWNTGGKKWEFKKTAAIKTGQCAEDGPWFCLRVEECHKVVMWPTWFSQRRTFLDEVSMGTTVHYPLCKKLSKHKTTELVTYPYIQSWAVHAWLLCICWYSELVILNMQIHAKTTCCLKPVGKTRNHSAALGKKGQRKRNGNIFGIN